MALDPLTVKEDMQPVGGEVQVYDVPGEAGGFFGNTEGDFFLAESGMNIFFRSHIADHFHAGLQGGHPIP